VKALQAWGALADAAGVSGARLTPLRSLGAVEGNTAALPSAFIAPTLVSRARHQVGGSSVKAASV